MTLPEPAPATAAVFALLSVHLCAVLIGLGAFPLAWLGEFLAGAKKNVFYKKLAQQLSGLGVLFLCYTLFSVGGSVAFLHVRYPEYVRPWLDAPWLAVPALAGLGWLTVFGLAYAFTWRGSKKNPGLHKTLGLLAALGAPLVLGGSLALKLVAAGSGLDAPATPQMLATLLEAGLRSPFFGPLFTGSVLQALTCAAGFGLVYLLTRRNRDDFGRDYYNFAVSTAAKWAVGCAVLTAAAHAWTASFILVLAEGSPSLELAQWIGGASFGALICAVLLWATVWRSKAPLRRKPAILLAALLLLLAVGAFAALSAGAFFPTG